MAYYKCGTIHPTQNSNVVIDTASGPIANFETPLALPLLDAQIDVNAVQDLHGQSGAYPAGGSAQKWDEEWLNGYLSSTDGSYISDANAICSKNFTEIQANTNYFLYKASSVPNTYVYWYDVDQLFISRGLVNNSVVASPNNAKYFKVSSYGYGTSYNNNISINYPSTDTAYHPYSNICPINGWDEISVVRCGKNLYTYDASKITTGITYTGATRSYLPLGLKGDCTLTFSASLKEGQEPTVQFVNIGKMVNGVITPLQALIQASSIFTRTIHFNAGEEIVLVSASEQTYALTSSLPKYDIQIEVGSQDTNYKPYTGSTTVIQLNNTYYGGRFIQDKSGKRKFEVTHKRYDLSALSWQVHQQGYYYATKPDDMYKYLSTETPEWIAEKYQKATGQWIYGHGSTIGYIGANGGLIYCTDSTTPSGYMVAPLTEPIVIDLPDGEPIATFVGTNNIFADTGDTAVKFRKIG